MTQFFWLSFEVVTSAAAPGAIDKSMLSACLSRLGKGLSGRLFAEHEPHGHAGAGRYRTWMRIFQLESRVVLARDLQDDGQAQSRSVHVGPQSAIERLKHQLTLSLRNARP